MQRAGGNAKLAQRGDLVVHQCDQRRNDNGGAGQAERRDLVAQALAAAGGHQHQRVTAADNVTHHLFLQAAKSREAEDAAHDRLGPIQRRIRRRRRHQAGHTSRASPTHRVTHVRRAGHNDPAIRARVAVHAQGPPMTISTRRLSWLVRVNAVAPSALTAMRAWSTPSVTSWSATTWARACDM